MFLYLFFSYNSSSWSVPLSTLSVIGCLHDPANFQQSSSKRPANIQLA